MLKKISFLLLNIMFLISNSVLGLIWGAIFTMTTDGGDQTLYIASIFSFLLPAAILTTLSLITSIGAWRNKMYKKSVTINALPTKLLIAALPWAILVSLVMPDDVLLLTPGLLFLSLFFYSSWYKQYKFVKTLKK